MNAFGEAMRTRRAQRDITQLGLAARIGRHGDKGLISKLESGKRTPDADLAAKIDEALGAGGDLVRLAGPPPAWMGALVEEDVPADPDSRVVRDHSEWRASRAALNRNRHALARVAASLYGGHAFGATGLITCPEWLPEQPVDLADITLDYAVDAPPPLLDGSEEETVATRPRQSIMRRFPRYHQAIKALAHPRLFENRMCWRLTDVSWTAGKGQLGFADSMYFAGVDVFEAASHELALAALDEHGTVRDTAPTLRDLPFRRLIGDPFDPSRRPQLCAISTLTIRRDRDSGTFLLHRRDPQSVAIAGGMLQVIPSGIFQPSSVMPAALSADFDLWRNIQREYSEELLGNAEHDGDGQPVRYDVEPFATLDAAREQGRLRVYCLGLALDALTLFGEILTVAVIDADLFDSLAPDFVDANDEGAVVNVGAPFSEAGVSHLLESGRLAPAGAGCLELAWRHREAIL